MSRNFFRADSSGRDLDNLKSRFGGPIFEEVDLLLTVSLVVVLHALVHVLLAVFQHSVG